MGSNPTRKNSPPIKVYCLPEEREAITEKAKCTGLSLSSYLLAVGLGGEIRSAVDHQQVVELAKVNGDLGRLGGLLKLWLTNDERTAAFDKATVLRLLERIDDKQEEIGRIMKQIVRPRAEKF